MFLSNKHNIYSVLQLPSNRPHPPTHHSVFMPLPSQCHPPPSGTLSQRNRSPYPSIVIVSPTIALFPAPASPRETASFGSARRTGTAPHPPLWGCNLGGVVLSGIVWMVVPDSVAQMTAPDSVAQKAAPGNAEWMTAPAGIEQRTAHEIQESPARRNTPCCLQ